MKKLLFTILSAVSITAAVAQAPNRIHYQAVLHGTDGSAMPGQTPVDLTFKINNGSIDVYTLDTNVQTSPYGVINAYFGNANFSNGQVNWGAESLTLKVTTTSGTLTNQKFTSVPYAFYANKAGSLKGVTLTGANDNDVLQYDASTQTWSPASVTAIDNDNQQLNVSSVGVISLANSTTTITIGITGNLLQVNGNTVATIPELTPPGTIVAYGGSSAPAGWLLCDGGPKDGTNSQFSALYAAIGNNFGGTGNQFNVPDFRGRFLRGSDIRSTGQNDPDNATRVASGAGGNTGAAVGSLQDDAFQGHNHHLLGSGTLVTSQTGVGGMNPIDALPNNQMDGSLYEAPPNGVPRKSSETRPKNVYVNYIIKL